MMMSQLRRSLPLFLSGGRRASSSCGTSDLLRDSDDSGLVLRSESTDVYQNLALEDWIDANVDLQRRQVLLLWRNRPAVVIGRHQNPWTECNLPAMRRAGVPLARRRSGGGTVYHDLGNLNLTFFTSKKTYDRRRNLKVVTEGLRRLRPQLDVQATDRFDIMLNGHLKISGTASRLSRTTSYHHCTLLHSANRSALSDMLRPSCPGIHSNATPSVPSPVANLLDHAPSLQWEELLQGLEQQYKLEFDVVSPPLLVDPSNESTFPGVGSMAAELRGWDWTFGRTPKFSVDTELQLSDESSPTSHSARLQMDVKGGRVAACRLEVTAGWLPERLSGELGDALLGERFCPHRAAAAFATLLRSENGPLQERMRILSDAVLSAMG